MEREKRYRGEREREIGERRVRTKGVREERKKIMGENIRER